MRGKVLPVIALIVGVATPVCAEQRQVSAAPSFDDCYRLAWVRGVHVEQDELPGWAEQCMAGHIPFDSGFRADSVKLSGTTSK